MSAVECPEALAHNSMNVPCFAHGACFTHYHHIRFDKRLPELSGLSHKAFDDVFVILGEHGRDGIPFGGEFKE